MCFVQFVVPPGYSLRRDLRAWILPVGRFESERTGKRIGPSSAHVSEHEMDVIRTRTWFTRLESAFFDMEVVLTWVSGNHDIFFKVVGFDRSESLDHFLYESTTPNFTNHPTPPSPPH